MSKLELETSVVSATWLYNNLDAENIIILNATIPKVTSEDREDSEVFQISNTRFFDIKNKFSDVDGEFPSTFPSSEQFETSAQELGINSDSVIIVYDEKGIYSSARAWYLFKAFGHKQVAVLNGGLPAWKDEKFPLEKKQNNIKVATGNFQAKLQARYMVFFEDILKIQDDSNYTIIDARSSDRFQSLTPEPRAGLRIGTIPNSKNLPFTTLLQGQKLLPKTYLEKAFKEVTDKNEKLVFSCGSGITACVLALGANVLGYKNTAVYDGSWTEYGSLVKKS